MSETDFSREHAERAEAQRFELEKMRERARWFAAFDTAELRLRWRLALLAALRQRAFLVMLSSDPWGQAVLASRSRRSRRRNP